MFAFITDLMRSADTYLYGRRMPTDARAELALLDERRFSNGVAHLRYRPL